MPINNNFEQLIQIANQQYNSITNDNNTEILFDNPSIRDNIFNIINQIGDGSNNNISINDISNNFINTEIDRLRSEEDQLIINNQKDTTLYYLIISIGITDALTSAKVL